MIIDKVTRVEVINHAKSLEKGGGRAFVFWHDNIKVELDLQDNDKTLKVFISLKDKKQ
jgi:hypothetical protein